MDDSLLACLRRVQSGTQGAFASLQEQYRPLVLSLVDSFLASMPAGSVGREDLIQEADIALYRAAIRYDITQDKVTFGLFAKVCIKNRLVSTLRRQKRLAKKPPRAAKQSATAEAVAFDQMPRAFLNLLTPYEEQVLRLRVESYSYKEIASRLSTDPKSVDNALCRIRQKIKRAKNQLSD